MLICKLPEGVRKVSDNYKSLNAAEGIGFANTTALFTYFLFGCTSLSQLARDHVNSPSVSDLSRAIQNFPGSRFMRRCRSSILKKYGDNLNAEDFVIAVDDTENPRYGKSIYGCGLWKSKRHSYFGQKILLLVLVDMRRRIAIPLHYTFLLNQGHPDYQPVLKKVIQLIDDCMKQGVPRLPIVADSWFDSGDLMRDFAERGLTFVVEIKSNRVARNSTGQWVRYRKVTETFKSPHGEVYAQPLKLAKKPGRPKLRFTESKVLQLKTFKAPVKIIAVFNKRSSKEAFAYYLSTDRTMPGATVWKISRARWCIEVLFRDLKQNLSFGRLPCSGKNAADLAVCLPLVLVTSLRLHPEIWNSDNSMTIGKIVKCIRNKALDDSFAALSLEKARDLRELVIARRAPNRFGRKPVNKAAA